MYICHDDDGNNCYSLSSLSEDWKTKSRFVHMTKYNEVLEKIVNCHIFKKTINVKCNTLKLIIEKHGIPDFIKIDVEGYEHIILKNFDQLLENTIFCFEWTEEFKNELISTIEYLDKLGYKHFYCLQEDKYLESVEEWKDKDAFLDFNSLCENRKELWGMIYFKK